MAEPKKYYWLKLKENFFNSKEVKKLRKIAGGDTFTIIYLKMQLISIKSGGLIKFEKTEEDLAEQLSIELDEDYDNVKITLSFLAANKLIEDIENDEFLLPKVPPLIGSETDAAERMRNMRNRNKVTAELQAVTQSKRKEIEKRDNIKEIEKEEETEAMKQAYRLATLLASLHQSFDPKYKGNIKSWTKDIEKLIRLDGRSEQEVEKVIRWVKDPKCFWFPNILSGKKLREKYPTLKTQMDRKKNLMKPKYKTTEGYDYDFQEDNFGEA